MLCKFGTYPKRIALFGPKWVVFLVAQVVGVARVTTANVRVSSCGFHFVGFSVQVVSVGGVTPRPGWFRLWRDRGPFWAERGSIWRFIVGTCCWYLGVYVEMCTGRQSV